MRCKCGDYYLFSACESNDEEPKRGLCINCGDSKVIEYLEKE
jgi:hypothetical protein